MPASAPQFGHEPVADIIDFAARRAAQHRGQPCPAAARPNEAEVAATQAWTEALARRGASIDDPAVRAAIAGITDLMKDIALGARHLRESGTGEGLDEVGAALVLDLVADLRNTPAVTDAVRAIAEEC